MNISRQFLIKLLLIGSLLLANFPAYSFPKGDYNRVKKLTLKILDEYPIEDNIFVGIGGSPAPFIAFIEAIAGKKQVIHLPYSTNIYSGLKGYKGDPTADIDKTSSEYREFENQLHKHFRHFLPKKQIGKKGIVLIDYTSSGTSIIAAYEAVNAFLKQEGRTNELHVAAITSPFYINIDDEGYSKTERHLMSLGFTVIQPDQTTGDILHYALDPDNWKQKYRPHPSMTRDDLFPYDKPYRPVPERTRQWLIDDFFEKTKKPGESFANFKVRYRKRIQELKKIPTYDALIEKMRKLVMSDTKLDLTSSACLRRVLNK